MNEKCKFCGNDSDRQDMYTIMDVPGGTLYFMKDQTHPGRVLLAAKRHVKRITDLSFEEYMLLVGSVYRIANVLMEIYQPDKINYLVLGDLGTHLHIHIVPKYITGVDWGKVFKTDEPLPHYLNEGEYIDKIREIKTKLIQSL